MMARGARPFFRMVFHDNLWLPSRTGGIARVTSQAGEARIRPAGGRGVGFGCVARQRPVAALARNPRVTAAGSRLSSVCMAVQTRRLAGVPDRARPVVVEGASTVVTEHSEADRHHQSAHDQERHQPEQKQRRESNQVLDVVVANDTHLPSGKPAAPETRQRCELVAGGCNWWTTARGRGTGTRAQGQQGYRASPRRSPRRILGEGGVSPRSAGPNRARTFARPAAPATGGATKRGALRRRT